MKRIKHSTADNRVNNECGSEKRLQLTISGETAVPIYIGEGASALAVSRFNLNSFTRRAILTDENVWRQWRKKISDISVDRNDLLIVLPAGEKHKTAETVLNIQAKLLEHNFDRKSLLINAGGGVVCDVGGFAAATFMRGMPFLHIPTTLLAQTDAAIGGKCGVNFGGLKNIIGVIAQPLAVLCDTDFLATLPVREFRSGFAEIIKHAAVANKGLFDKLRKTGVAKLKDGAMPRVLEESIRVKCGIVAADVTDTGKRNILNFGHTIGHALEMASLKNARPLLHGEAVAVGMVAEAKLSCLAGLLHKADLKSLEEVIGAAGLPVSASPSLRNTVMAKIAGDKKNEGGRIKWTLLKGIGNTVYKVEQPGEKVKMALDYVLR